MESESKVQKAQARLKDLEARARKLALQIEIYKLEKPKRTHFGSAPKKKPAKKASKKGARKAKR